MDSDTAGVLAPPPLIFVAGLVVGFALEALLPGVDMPALVEWGLGGLLVVAGLYQWLPIKRACLSHCRSPLGFFSSEWREGVWGALWMGMRHGSFCVGCCWLLMALLFVVGVMNLPWVVGIAGLVLVEKLVRGGAWMGRLAGVGMVGWGVWLFRGVAR